MRRISSRHSPGRSNPVRCRNCSSGQPAVMRNPKAAISPARASGPSSSLDSMARRPRSSSSQYRVVFARFRVRAPRT